MLLGRETEALIVSRVTEDENLLDSDLLYPFQPSADKRTAQALPLKQWYHAKRSKKCTGSVSFFSTAAGEENVSNQRVSTKHC